jgi:hypothetical protein
VPIIWPNITDKSPGERNIMTLTVTMIGTVSIAGTLTANIIMIMTQMKRMINKPNWVEVNGYQLEKG